jgi:hypothetical protein
MDSSEPYLNGVSESSSKPPSKDGANMRISGAIHDERRLCGVIVIIKSVNQLLALYHNNIGVSIGKSRL